MERIPAPGDLYSHLTDKIYQVITVAVHAQTGEQMVVYQAMFGDFGIYTMPLADFAGEMQDEKKSSSGPGMQGRADSGLGMQGMADSGVHVQSTADSGPNVRRPADSKRAFIQNAAKAAGDRAYGEKRRRQIEEREQRRGLFRKPEKHETATEELRANPCLLKFLEADTYEERFHVLNQIQDEITDRLIDDMAVVLDVVIPEGALSDRFQQLKDVILTRQKYETSRFR